MKFKVLIGLGIVTMAWSGAQQCVRAQETAQSEVAASEWQVREIAVKNVPVRMMASWLDSAHNAEPLSLKSSRQAQLFTGDTPSRSPQQIFASLPTGVNSVTVASDKRNSILVVGNLAGIETVAAAVQKFDKPLRQIEIEMQAVQLSAAEVKNLGLQFSALTGEINKGRKTPITMARTPDGEALQAKVLDLLAQNKAKILSAPRVTAINGLTASLRSEESTPFLMSFDNSGSFPKPLLNQRTNTPDAVLYVTTATGLTVTPTLNENRTVSLDLMPAKTLQVGIGDFSTNAKRVGTLQGFRHQLTVKDGETVAFGGVSSALYAGSEGKKQLPANMILLVKTRILPRLGEDETPEN